MVSRSRTDTEKTPPNGAPGDAASPGASMKVTVDEVALRTLYERMLKSRGGNGVDRTASDMSPQQNKAMIATTIDLHAGDAISLVDTDVFSSSDLGDEVHLLPAHLCIAAGVALAYKLQGEHRVVLSLVRASTLDLGSAHEALTYASSQKLPLIVVVDCENVSQPDAFEARAAAYGIPSISVDANDAVALYRVSREAIDRARAANGPTLVQCLSFESKADPIERLEHYLDKHGWWSAAWKQQLIANRSRH